MTDNSLATGSPHPFFLSETVTFHSRLLRRAGQSEWPADSFLSLRRTAGQRIHFKKQRLGSLPLARGCLVCDGPLGLGVLVGDALDMLQNSPLRLLSSHGPPRGKSGQGRSGGILALPLPSCVALASSLWAYFLHLKQENSAHLVGPFVVRMI